MVPVMKRGWIAVALSVALAGCASEEADSTAPSSGKTTSGPTGTANPDRRGIEVPGVVGMSLSKAQETLDAADLPYFVRSGISDESPGMVLWQTPGEGQRLLPGDSVWLVVANERPRCLEYNEAC